MAAETQRTDKEARISLPRAFAETAVIIEQISETELRIRKVMVNFQNELQFDEERAMLLSDRDRDLFLSLLDDPPAANDALKRAAAKYKNGQR